MTIKATSDAAFRRLIGRVVSFYSESLFDPHWGEQIAFQPGNVLAITMVFQGLDQQQAETIWRPFLDWLAGSPEDFSIESAPWIAAVPARQFWDPGMLKELPGVVLADDRAGRARGQRVLGGQSGRGGTGAARLSVGMAPPRSCSRTGRNRSPMPCSRRAGIGACPAPQQGLGGRACRRDSRSEGHGNESRGAGCLRADHQRGRGPPGYPGIPGHEPDRRPLASTPRRSTAPCRRF